jgi:excisionase family DNA binding protein
MVRLPRNLLILSDAAREAGLSPVTLRVQIKNGRLKATKLGRDWYVTRAQLNAYLNQRGVRSH